MYFLSINRVRKDADPASIGRVVGAHVQWLKALISQGVVRQAGKWGEAGGIVIIVAKDQIEAEAIQEQDPLVGSKLVTYELARFYPDVELG
jgi:uncharacterized protein YciI